MNYNQIKTSNSDGMKVFNSLLEETICKIYKPSFPEFRKDLLLEDLDECVLESGEYHCDIQGISFRFLLQKKDSDMLYVFLNSAAGFDENKKTQYNRWSWSNLTNANVLNITDPMYFMYNNLPIGWYYGDSKTNLRELLARLIISIAKKLSIPTENCILYGSSSGGTAALYTSHYLPGSFSIGINPQIYLWKHEWYEEFKKIVSVDPQNDNFYRSDFIYHLTNSPHNKFLVIVNSKSRVDYNWQYVPLMKKLGCECKYGLSQIGNLYTWVWDTGKHSKHSLCDFPELFVGINQVIKYLRYNHFSVANDMACTINELYRGYCNHLQL
jgi:hypothetical protein